MYEKRIQGSFSEHIYSNFRRNRFDSPRSDLLFPPYAYTRWLPYNFLRESYRGPIVKESRTRDLAPPYYYISSWYEGMTFTSPSVTWPDNVKVLSKLVDKWKNSDINVGVSLGEGKESIGMILGALQKIHSSAKAIRRGNLGEALKILPGDVPRSHRRKAARALSSGDASSAYLALHLGWVPAINDVYAYAEYVRNNGGYARIASPWVRGSASLNLVSDEYYRGKILKADARMRYVTVIRTPPTEYDRLGLTNPAVIAWELVPLSFVADYFLPIGDAINALSLFRMDNSAMNTFKESRLHLKAMYPGLKKGQKFGWTSWAAEATSETIYQWKSYDRSVVSLTQQLVSSTFTVSIPTSLSRLANMAALTHQSLLNLRKVK